MRRSLPRALYRDGGEGFSVAVEIAAEHLVELEPEHLDAHDEALHAHHEEVADDDDRGAGGVPDHLGEGEDDRHHARVAEHEAAHAEEGHRVGEKAEHHLKELEGRDRQIGAHALLRLCAESAEQVAERLLEQDDRQRQNDEQDDVEVGEIVFARQKHHDRAEEDRAVKDKARYAVGGENQRGRRL